MFEKDQWTDKIIIYILKNYLFCFVWYIDIQEIVRHPTAFLVLLKSSSQKGVHRLCFVAFESTVWKLWNLKVFMNLEIELKYLLFWKFHKYHIIGLNAMKQTSTLLCA